MNCCLCGMPIAAGEPAVDMPDPYTGKPAHLCIPCRDEGLRLALEIAESDARDYRILTGGRS